MFMRMNNNPLYIQFPGKKILKLGLDFIEIIYESLLLYSVLLKNSSEVDLKQKLAVAFNL